jgi:hypothetical protein
LPLPASLGAFLPGFVLRLGAILAALAALVARRLLADPVRAPLVVPLWRYVTRVSRRLAATFARVAAGRLPRPRRPRSGAAHARPALPGGHAWLVAALGAEAAASASQLAALLAEPQAVQLLARCPAAERTLARLRRMLGIAPPRRRRPVPLVRPAAAAALPRRGAGLALGAACPRPAGSPPVVDRRPSPPHSIAYPRGAPAGG